MSEEKHLPEDWFVLAPDAEPVPVPDPVLLPAPDGVDVHGTVAHWRLANGEWLFARPGRVFGFDSVDAAEGDALAVLGACAWARQSSEGPGSR